MKPFLFAIFVMFGVLLSCNNDLATDDLKNEENLLMNEKLVGSLFAQKTFQDNSEFKKTPNANAVTKKFKVRATGTMSMEACEFGEGFGKSIIEGRGNATHLGLFTVSLSYCFDENGPVENIYATQIAANGDELYSVVIGADPEENSLDFSYYGGTGRFENASGFITLYFTFDYANGTFTNFGEGTITY